MKKILIGLLVIFLVIGVKAQNTPEHIAFEKSYKKEQYLKYDEAIKEVEKVYSAESYSCNIRLGWLYYLKKEYVKSQNYYLKAIELKPNSIEAYFGYIYPLNASKKYKKVESQYKKILSIAPSNSDALYYLGYLYYNSKDFKSAEIYFQKLINLFPLSYNGVIILAWTKLKLGKTTEAKQLFNLALLINPNSTSAKNGLKVIK